MSEWVLYINYLLIFSVFLHHCILFSYKLWFLKYIKRHLFLVFFFIHSAISNSSTDDGTIMVINANRIYIQNRSHPALHSKGQLLRRADYKWQIMPHGLYLHRDLKNPFSPKVASLIGLSLVAVVKINHHKLCEIFSFCTHIHTQQKICLFIF